MYEDTTRRPAALLSFRRGEGKNISPDPYLLYLLLRSLPKNRPALIPSRRHMIDRALKLNSSPTRHEPRVLPQLEMSNVEGVLPKSAR
jgi:hypothetical protein